jgi:hypothetical protein
LEDSGRLDQVVRLGGWKALGMLWRLVGWNLFAMKAFPEEIV